VLWFALLIICSGQSARSFAFDETKTHEIGFFFGSEFLADSPETFAIKALYSCR